MLINVIINYANVIQGYELLRGCTASDYRV